MRTKEGYYDPKWMLSGAILGACLANTAPVLAQSVYGPQLMRIAEAWLVVAQLAHLCPGNGGDG